MKYIYVKDNDGFVVKKLQSDLLPDEQIITEEEYKELSGENYYQKKFGHGGKRKGAGRKPANGLVLKFQIRVNKKEKEFLKFAREHHIDYDSLMEG